MTLTPRQQQLWDFAKSCNPDAFTTAIGTTNIGDDIQSEAARRWFGLTDHQWNFRDSSPRWIGVVPLCGWFHKCPKPSKAQWVVIGFHLYDQDSLNVDAMKRAVDEQGFAAGCRDEATARLLRLNGIDAEFSGCVTQTLATYAVERKGKIAIDSLAPTADWSCMSHLVPSLQFMHPCDRLESARSRIKMIGGAEAIHTRRMHAYLPARAMGVPEVTLPDNFKPRNAKRWEGHVKL